MKYCFFLFAICLVRLSASGQELYTLSELNGARDAAAAAKSEASSALQELERINAYSTLSDILAYGENAESDLSDAQGKSGNAASDASDAAYAADRIDCNDAENKASSAKSRFEAAESEFRNAYGIVSRMGNSENTAHESALAGEAVYSIKRGIDLLNDGLQEIDTARSELDDCD